MEQPTIFNFENRITEFRRLKQKLKKEFNESHIRYSGINVIEDLIQGFDSEKRYTIVTNKGMGALSIVHLIVENFNLIYGENFNIDEHLFDLNSANIIHRKHERWYLNYFELSEAITKRKDHQKRPVLIDVPNQIQDQSDVIIAIYRPEYYDIETWEDETSTENQIEISLLKNHKTELGSQKLMLDKSNRQVESLDSSFFQQWVRKFSEFVTKELD